MKQTALEYLKDNSDWFDKSPGGENLYFESEVIKMMENYSYQTEISDEEIEKWAKEYTCKEYEKLIFDYENYDEYRDFVNGAKKYREQIKKVKA
jgi:hypothetical protein